MKHLWVTVETAIVAAVGGGIVALLEVAEKYLSDPTATPIDMVHLQRTFVAGAIVSAVALYRRRPGSEGK